MYTWRSLCFMEQDGRSYARRLSRIMIDMPRSFMSEEQSSGFQRLITHLMKWLCFSNLIMLEARTCVAGDHQ
jgi:hypothetical protein